MTVYVADVHAHVQRRVSLVKMATVLVEHNTEEQNSVAHFLWTKESNTKIFIKKYCLFTVGSFCRVKSFETGWQTFR
jgi:hypothetical protein